MIFVRRRGGRCIYVRDLVHLFGVAIVTFGRQHRAECSFLFALLHLARALHHHNLEFGLPIPLCIWSSTLRSGFLIDLEQDASLYSYLLHGVICCMAILQDSL